MTNPWLSVWLSAANSWAGAARGFWTAEMQRQQTVVMNQMIEQTTRFWMQTWSPGVPGRKQTRRRR
jgi:hypothetical protein